MPPPAISCPGCKVALPAAAKFCSECGARVAPRNRPISWQVAERRYFGILPGRSLLPAARARGARLWAAVVGRLRLMRETGVAYAVMQLELLRMRRQAATLAAERDRALFALGEAVYHDDAKETGEQKARVAELDGRIAAAERSMRASRERREDRIARAHQEGGRTVAVELPPTVPEPSPHEPPGPVIVPEPEPVPQEPPGPVIVPEPEPVPQEPPGPVIVPEPAPPRKAR